jgi:hypothetical protein
VHRENRKPKEKDNEISRGSVIEIDAALNIASDLRYLTEIEN